MPPMQALSVLILLPVSEFCENLLKEDNSNNTFSDVMSQLSDSIFRLQIIKIAVCINRFTEKTDVMCIITYYFVTLQ